MASADEQEQSSGITLGSMAWCCTTRPRGETGQPAHTKAGTAVAGGVSHDKEGGKPAISRLAKAVHSLRSSSSASLSTTVLQEASDTITNLCSLAGLPAASGEEGELKSWREAEVALARLQIAVRELARKERTHQSAKADMRPANSPDRGQMLTSSPATAVATSSTTTASATSSTTTASATSSPAAAATTSSRQHRAAGPVRPRSLAATRSAWQGLPGGSSHALGDLVRRQSADVAASLDAGDVDDGEPSIHEGSESLGIRILTIDGGSIRGLAVVEALRQLEAEGGRPIADMFDLIVGTSIGGFLAAMIGIRRCTMDECVVALWKLRVSMYRAQGDGMLSGAKRIALGTAFDSEVHAESIQDTLGTEARMDEAAGSPKVAMVATCIDKSPAKPLLLRTYRLDEEARRRSAFEGTCNVTQLDAVRATTAAPTFFPPTMVDGRLCVDGACIANNPAVIALAEAATLWPHSHVEALVSVGTGLQSEAMHPGTSLVDWLTFQVNASMDCHLAHAITASMLGRGHYFRINFPGVGDVALNETSVEVIEDMVTQAVKHLETEEAKTLIREAAAVLTSKPASELVV